MRADIHVLFDKHLIAIDENSEIEVGGDLMKTVYGQGLTGTRLQLPVQPGCPSKEALAIHRASLLRNRMD